MIEARKQPPVPTLAAPLVILQVRCGAGGGSPHRIDMLGQVSRHVGERSAAEMPWSDEIDEHQPSRVYALGGRIPEGRVLVVTSITWRALTQGDGDSPGEFSVMMGSEIISHDRDNGSYSGNWSGRIELRAGEESTVQVQVSNSSAVDVRIEGEFEDESK